MDRYRHLYRDYEKSLHNDFYETTSIVKSPQGLWSLLQLSSTPKTLLSLLVRFTNVKYNSFYMDVSENSCIPEIIHFHRVFHYFDHPFWGYPYFWKHPYTDAKVHFILKPCKYLLWDFIHVLRSASNKTVINSTKNEYWNFPFNQVPFVS